MDNLLEAVFSVAVYAGAIRIATPLLLAAIGEMITERAGILNLGVEGQITFGAFISFFATDLTGSLWLGVLAAIVGGAIAGLLMAFVVSTVKVDQVVAGLAMNLVLIGLSFFWFRSVFTTTSSSHIFTVETFEYVEIPGLSEIPIFGEILFTQHWLTFAAPLLFFGVWFGLNRTSFGLELCSVGHNPEACDMRGINIPRAQYIGVMLGGVMSALAGAFLSLGVTGLFFPDIASGRGWIAIALVIFGNWRIGRIVAGALFFGFLEALQLALQARGVDLPYQLLLGLPFALTIVALVVNRRRSNEPMSLAVPYHRGQR